ncbi:MAG: hypothetical protein DRP15_04225 [Candidatus Aenigmatarchaeota archaeon]|nr:MAG: hypothetical protein DRP15_04225 [Candidatus Aenigmarchaeota archaeon]
MKKGGTRLLTIVGSLCLVTLAVAVCALSRICTDAERDGLRGPVREIVEETYRLVDKFGTVTQELEKRVISQYNREGALTERVSYDGNGNITSHSVYVINADGRSSEIITYNGLGNVESQSAITYESSDTTERKIHRMYNADGSLDYVYVYNYNTDGHMVEAVHYNADGSLDMRGINSYDAQGKLLETDMYDAQGKLFMKITWTYSEQGVVIESSSILYLNGIEWLTGRMGYSDYELDAYENWIKRVESEWVEKFGKEYWEPRKVIYRTINYYEE